MPKPNFFIVGASKCGTTSLYHYLRQHPEVFMPDRKEPHFFSVDIERPNRISEEEYYELFDTAGAKKRIGEASADYLYSAVACDEIARIVPHAGIIIALRNPVDKIHSTHSYALWLGREVVEDFEEALARDEEQDRPRYRKRKYIEGGKYSKYVRRYLEAFSPNQVHIVLFEDMVKDPARVFVDLCKFLEISADVSIDFGRHNPSKKARVQALSRILPPYSPVIQWGRRLPTSLQPILGSVVRGVKKWNTRFEERQEMRPELRRRLEAEFAEDVAELSDLLGMNLSRYWFGMEGALTLSGHPKHL